MGSDKAHVTDSEPVEQEPESASDAKTKPSDNSSGADGSGPPGSPLRRHQNSKQEREVLEGPKGPGDDIIHAMKAPVKEFTFVASMRSGSACPKPSDSSGGGDGSGAPCACSLTEERARMLKKNSNRHAFGFGCEHSGAEWAHMKDSTWLATVVGKLRVEPCLDNSEAQIEELEAPTDPEKARLSASHEVSMEDLETTPLDGSGAGDGTRSATWSLTEEEHVQNLKRNYKRLFLATPLPSEFRRLWKETMEDSSWFLTVVQKVRDHPCSNNLEIKLDVPVYFLVRGRLLHFAVLMEDLEMVQKILETHSVFTEVHIDSITRLYPIHYSALDLAIMIQEDKIVDALLEKKATINMGTTGSLQLAVLFAPAHKSDSTSKIIQSLVHKGIDINGKDEWEYSAFYLAVALNKTNTVKELLKWKDKIDLNEECSGGRPPIQIANQEGFKDIESALMQCDDVRRYIDSAFRDRQAYVDAANAILVGEALIASVTFASWLQPPLSYTSSHPSGSLVEYVDVEHNIALGSFWVFNTLSFYFAIGTVVFGAHSVLSRRQLFITENVKKLSQNLILTSILLAFSVLFVMVAFGIAGIIVLIPILRYRWYMIAPTILGGIVCLGSVGYLFKSLWENGPWKNKNRKMDEREKRDIKFWYNYYDNVEVTMNRI